MDNLGLWQLVRVGRARADGQFDLLWDFGDELRPVRFPAYRPRYEWNRIVETAMKRP